MPHKLNYIMMASFELLLVTGMRGTRFLDVTVEAFVNDIVDCDGSRPIILDQDHNLICDHWLEKRRSPKQVHDLDIHTKAPDAESNWH